MSCLLQDEDVPQIEDIKDNGEEGTSEKVNLKTVDGVLEDMLTGSEAESTSDDSDNNGSSDDEKEKGIEKAIDNLLNTFYFFLY